MSRNLIAFGIVLLFLAVVFSGCNEQTSTDTNNNNNNRYVEPENEPEPVIEYDDEEVGVWIDNFLVEFGDKVDDAVGLNVEDYPLDEEKWYDAKYYVDSKLDELENNDWFLSSTCEVCLEWVFEALESYSMCCYWMAKSKVYFYYMIEYPLSSSFYDWLSYSIEYSTNGNECMTDGNAFIEEYSDCGCY